MPQIIITIDGYSSCGKSTLARQLAASLNYIFVDSGAMYRAITLYFIKHDIDLFNTTAVSSALNTITLEFRRNAVSGNNDMYLNGENVEQDIRGMRVSDHVSEVAALKAVREFAVAQQQKMGEKKGLVMDGRDIGTTVFPSAALKIFMTADPAVRALRRYNELYEKDKSITIEEVKHNLELRDYTDSHREVSPLRKADDAIILDNSSLSATQQLEMVLAWAKEKDAG